MTLNSQGKPRSQQFQEEKEREKQYLVSLQALLDRRDQGGGVWTVALAREYKQLLRTHGIIAM